MSVGRALKAPCGSEAGPGPTPGPRSPGCPELPDSLPAPNHVPATPAHACPGQACGQSPDSSDSRLGAGAGQERVPMPSLAGTGAWLSLRGICGFPAEAVCSPQGSVWRLFHIPASEGPSWAEAGALTHPAPLSRKPKAWGAVSQLALGPLTPPGRSSVFRESLGVRLLRDCAKTGSGSPRPWSPAGISQALHRHPGNITS